jgi:hypothetical protein
MQPIATVRNGSAPPSSATKWRTVLELVKVTRSIAPAASSSRTSVMSVRGMAV